MDDRLHADLRRFGESHWWYEGRRRVVEAELASLGLVPGAAILDVGCGSGAMLPSLARFGTVTGIETDIDAVRHCEEVHADVATVVHGSLPDALPADGDLDLVTAFDVIEHLDDDAGALRAASRSLRPGGRLLLTVPAFPSLWGPQDELSHHRRRYRKATLTAAFDGSGLQIDRMTYFNCFLFPPIAALRWSRRLLPARRGEAEMESDFSVGPDGGWLASVLESVFAAERHVLRVTDLPFGVSLLAVATRV